MKTRFTLLSILFFAVLRAQAPYTENLFAYDSLLNVTYGIATDYAGNADTLLMDIYKPHGDGNCKRPVMVLVHGGAWIAGSKSDFDLVYFSRNLAAKGWVVADINYREGTHKAANYSMDASCNTRISTPGEYICDSSEIFRANFRAMQDAKGAIRFMKKRNAIDSSDVNNVFIAGESAGGFISLETAFTDQASEKPMDCYAIADAPSPDPDMATYGCVPSPVSFARPDLGSIDGTLNIGMYDAKVKGVGSFFGGVMDLNIFQQQTDTPAVYMYHQGSDVVVSYTYGPILGRLSQECYGQANLCQPYYFYPYAYGSEGIRQYFVSLGTNAPLYQADINYNYHYMNDCRANGHSIDYLQTRLRGMVDLFAPLIAASGNNPLTNCQVLSVNPDPEGSFQIFPNPSSGKFSIQFLNPMTNPEVKIYSSLGELVFEQKENSGNVQLISIAAELDAGVYFISVETKEEKLSSSMVIVK
ncbi:MAG TPA: T9SS type A sorting domain-containing protein [Bacteroidia bacterium]|nr:T9SS type A sorting domain-containing protein [Bacteroidia bacterium]